MESVEVAEILSRILKQAVEKPKYTGCIDVHIDCTQGHIRTPKIILTDTFKRISIFEYGEQGKVEL